MDADADFNLLEPRTKVNVLWNLINFRLDQEDVSEQLNQLETDSVRVDPLGYDANGATYWYFFGTRLYREDKVKGAPSVVIPSQAKKQRKNKENGAAVANNWQLVCSTEDDWLKLADRFAKSRNKNEKELHAVLTENFLAEIGALLRKRERDQRNK